MATYVQLCPIPIDSTRTKRECHRAASKDLELEAKYLTLLKETSTYEKNITRDLGRLVQWNCLLLEFSDPCYRTFPHHNYFTDGQGIGQENLFNVLKAYSLWILLHPDYHPTN